MEMNNEVKGTGTGNSYDFGARIYDPRLARWMAVDPQFKKQIGWSGYKAFLDCPLIYSDHDGETEYLTTFIENKQTGETQIEVTAIKNQVMTDRQKVEK